MGQHKVGQLMGKQHLKFSCLLRRRMVHPHWRRQGSKKKATKEPGPERRAMTTVAAVRGSHWRGQFVLQEDVIKETGKDNDASHTISGPSGPKPYENALRASGSSTMIREYGRLAMTCDGADQLLCISWCTYLAAWGRGDREYSVGGGSRTSSSPCSSQQALGTSHRPASVSLPQGCRGCPWPRRSASQGGTILGHRAWRSSWQRLDTRLYVEALWRPASTTPGHSPPQLHEHCFPTPRSCTKGNGSTAHGDPSPSSPDPHAQMVQRLAQLFPCCRASSQAR